MLQHYDHEPQPRFALQLDGIGSTKSRGLAQSMLPVPPPLSVVARTLLSMTLAIPRPFPHRSFPFARSPHAGARASDWAFSGRHQTVRDALLPAPRGFVQWVFLVPIPCFYKLDGKRLSDGKISSAIVSKRSRHLLSRE